MRLELEWARGASQWLISRWKLQIATKSRWDFGSVRIEPGHERVIIRCHHLGSTYAARNKQIITRTTKSRTIHCQGSQLYHTRLCHKPPEEAWTALPPGTPQTTTTRLILQNGRGHGDSDKPGWFRHTPKTWRTHPRHEKNFHISNPKSDLKLYQK